MPRPRSRSPHYRMSPRRHEAVGGHSRRFPWDEPDFDPQKVLAELDRMPMDRNRHPRQDLDEQWANVREDIRSGGQRRSPFPDDQQSGHQRRQDLEEFYRRTPPPHPQELGYAERRRLSPKQAHHRHDGGGAKGRGGFREDIKHFENRGRPLHSPQRLTMESLTPTPQSQSNRQQREPAVGWREDRDRSGGRSRDFSPRARADDQGRAEGRERGRRHAQGPTREKQREEGEQERSLLKRPRREMEGAGHLGYRKEEEFRERPRDGFGGGARGGSSHRAGRRPGPLVVEHDHGIAKSGGLPQWEQFEDRRDCNLDFDGESHPRQRSSSQEHFRKSHSRSDVGEDMRGRHIQDGRRDFGRETRRSPMQQDRTSPMGQGGPMNHMRSPDPVRGRANRGRGARMETAPPRNHLRINQFPQGRQDLPQERQRPAYRPTEGERYEDSGEEEPSWAEEPPLRQWVRDRPGGLDRRSPRDDLDPEVPRQREHKWNIQQKTNEMKVVAEETLTIKVDMNRPVNQNSPLCYSSDRQLSLDLVHVGRQRLDFLPMLEHSGTYRESAMHTGTFAQEIITLVHQVKENYFRGEGITLNERFSAPQEGGFPEEDMDKLGGGSALHRQLSIDMNTLLLPDAEPLFTSVGTMQSLRQQLVRDPGDLRHDLERRRQERVNPNQERLEGVKVTIPGGSLSQRLPGPMSERMEFSDKAAVAELEGGFSSWSEEQDRRWGDDMATRRGSLFKHNTGPQRRNNRLGNRLGPMRRQNNRSDAAGPSW